MNWSHSISFHLGRSGARKRLSSLQRVCTSLQARWWASLRVSWIRWRMRAAHRPFSGQSFLSSRCGTLWWSSPLPWRATSSASALWTTSPATLGSRQRRSGPTLNTLALSGSLLLAAKAALATRSGFSLLSPNQKPKLSLLRGLRRRRVIEKKKKKKKKVKRN